MKYVLILIVLFFSFPATAKPVVFEGEITFEYLKVFIKKVEKGDTVIFNSLGGQKKAGYMLEEIIKKLELNTHVNSTGICASACVNAYSAGKIRTAGKNAMFIIHDVYITDKKGNKIIKHNYTNMSMLPRLFSNLGNNKLWSYFDKTKDPKGPGRRLVIFRPLAIELNLVNHP